MKTQNATVHHEIETAAMTELEPGRKPTLALPLRLLLTAALVLPTLAASASVILTTPYTKPQRFYRLV